MMFRAFARRRSLVAVAAAVATATAIFVGIAYAAGPASPGQGREPETYTIGLFGDMRYGALGRSQYPNLLADINQGNVAFSIFDGDLQAGGDGPCNDSLYTTALANFSTLERPLIWVPGDNDWTDCWGRYGTAQQPYHDPIERLNYERKLFDSTDQPGDHRRLAQRRARPIGFSSRGGHGPPPARHGNNVSPRGRSSVAALRVNAAAGSMQDATTEPARGPRRAVTGFQLTVDGHARMAYRPTRHRGQGPLNQRRRVPH